LAPFCKESYEKHNSSQHSIEWEKYKKASMEEKMEFFETMKFVSIEHFIRMNGDILEFIVDSKIVKDIIAHLFFCLEDNLDTLSLEKSMVFFKKKLDSMTSYSIVVKNVKWFDSLSITLQLVYRFVKCPLLLISTKRRLGMRS